MIYCFPVGVYGIWSRELALDCTSTMVLSIYIKCIFLFIVSVSQLIPTPRRQLSDFPALLAQPPRELASHTAVLSGTHIHLQHPH